MRGGRRRSVDLQLPRRRHQQHPRLRARLPRRARSSSSSRTTARRRRSSRPPTRSSPTTTAASRRSCGPTCGEGEPVHVRRARGRARRGRASSRPRSSGSATRRASPASDVAVFYRTNAQSRVLEDTLVRFGVCYQVIGGTKFYERAEIKDALAYLTLLVNPSDTVSFARVVNSPKRGIGQTTQGRVLAHANTMGEPVVEVAAVPEVVPGLAPAAVKALDRFASVMERLRELSEHASVGELLESVLAGDRLHGGARGRAHDRGAGPAREPAGAGRRRAGVRRQLGGRARAGRRSPSSFSSCRSTPSRTRCGRARSRSR